jgi:hypothetical protein
MDITILKGISTSVDVISFSDRSQIDRAVEILTRGSSFAVAAKWGPYGDVTAIQLCNGKNTFIFQRSEQEELPVVLKLLLTHQDYEKARLLTIMPLTI